MPEVNGEVIHQPLHVGPPAIPIRQSMNRKGMPKVVQPRLEATAVCASHAGMVSESLEGILHGPSVDCHPASTDEEVALGFARRMRIGPPAGIIAQHLGQLWTDRDQPRFEELGITDGEQGIRQVYVCRRQSSASPRRNPAPYNSNKIARRVGGSNRHGKR